MILATLIGLALQEDLGDAGDITSDAIYPDMQIKTRIVAKESGVIAGLYIVQDVYGTLDPDVKVTPLVEDGTAVQIGDPICEIIGAVKSVLAGERTALNFLQRLSGVATLSRQFVDAIAGTDAKILDTRKTTPGYRQLQKYAVQVGGGTNHRMGLYDEVMIKDNHIDAAGSITEAVKRVREHPIASQRPMVIEVKNLDELREALALKPTRILLDNMPPDIMRGAVQLTAGRIPLEASGNVTLETVRTIAETGVQYISVGALTHSAKILDLSMRVV